MEFNSSRKIFDFSLKLFLDDTDMRLFFVSRSQSFMLTIRDEDYDFFKLHNQRSFIDWFAMQVNEKVVNSN